MPFSLGGLGLLKETLQVDALGPLDGQTKRAVPDELREGAKAARYAEGGGIIQRLVEAVVVEEHAGAAVDIRVGVLGLAVGLEHVGSDAAVLLDELEDGVLGDLWARGGVVHQSFEARVGLAQDGVAVAGDDAAGVEGRPEVVGHVLVGVRGGDVVLHLEDPAEDLLRGKSVGHEC